MANDNKPVDVLAVPISVGRQEREPTDPRITFYRTRLHFGTADNPGNTVAFVSGNNGSNAAEQMAFAEKLVRAYNRDAAVAELVEAARTVNTCDLSDLPGDVVDMLRAALAKFGGAA